MIEDSLHQEYDEKKVMAVFEINKKIFNIKEGFHLVGNRNVEISIHAKSVDLKHGLLEITKYGMKIIDLNSKNGTFLNEEKIESLQSILLPKKCSLKFGNIKGDLVFLNEGDSGFLEKPSSPKDASNVMAGNPEQIESYSRNLQNRITSTPNNINYTKDNLTSTFFEEDDIISHEHNKKKDEISETNSNNSFKRDGNLNITDSFTVPETQANVDIFDNIKDDIIRKSVENMSKDDEFYIPETQEIFNNNTPQENTQTGIFRISSQDFQSIDFNEESSFSKNNKNSKNSQDCSQILFDGIQLSSEIPKITVKDNVETISNPTINKSTTNLTNNVIELDDYDDEISNLNWNQSKTKQNNTSFAPIVSNSSTPNLDLTDHELLLHPQFNNEKTVVSLRENSVTPEFILEVNKNIEIYDDFDNIDSNKSDNRHSKENVDDELEPTQIFKKIPFLSSTIKKPSIQDYDDSDYTQTQVFIRPNNLFFKDNDKENTIINKQNKLFMKNKIQLIDENDDSMALTQQFLPKKEKILKNVILESDDEDKQNINDSFIQHSKQVTSRKQNKILDSSDENDVPIVEGCSKKVVVLKKNKNIANESTPKLKSKSDNFDFITNTPQFNFIKTHQTTEIKEAGDLCASKRIPFPLEIESDDDDSECIAELVRTLNSKNNNKKPQHNLRKQTITKKSEDEICKIPKESKNIKIRSDNTVKKLTKDCQYESESQNSKDKSCRKSNRKKAAPVYIDEDFITDMSRFSQESVNDNNREIKSITRKRSNKDSSENESIPKKSKIKSVEKNEPDKNSKKNIAINRVAGRKKKDEIHKFVFTNVESSIYEEVIKSMGCGITNDPTVAAILITNNLSRTFKFMVALARGIPIISNTWLDKIIETNHYTLSYKKYYVNDPFNEKKFNFCLLETLKLAGNNKVFNNFTFLITPTTLPPPGELNHIIKCAGGKIIKKLPNEADISNFYVVSSKNDSKRWIKIKKQLPNVNIIATEAILLSIMQQKLRFADHML